MNWKFWLAAKPKLVNPIQNYEWCPDWERYIAVIDAKVIVAKCCSQVIDDYPPWYFMLRVQVHLNAEAGKALGKPFDKL